MDSPVYGLVAGVVAAALALGCEDAAENTGWDGPKAAVIEAVTVRSESFREMADLLGELQAAESVTVKVEVPGVIDEVAFEEGQPVEKGEILFRLRDREQAARVREAQARLALAQDQFGRTQRLASRNAAAEAQLERARAELEVARAELELAEVELERTRVRAPFDGLAGVRLVSPGARVTPDDPLVRIDAIQPLELGFSIPEFALPLARLGAEFALKVAAFPDRTFRGNITFIAPNIDSATRRVLIKGRVPNEERLLLPGMFARLEAELDQRETFLLPEEAIVSDASGTYVWRIDDEGIAERVPVELGSREPGRVEIRSGLDEGDRIVSAGTHKVREGGRVEAVPVPIAGGAEPTAPPAAAAPPDGGDA